MSQKSPGSLEQKLARLIETTGPIALADYMHLCLADPQFGYYKTREAIGRKGDFVTAPEISQMFGELIGIWCVAAWQAMDRPKAFSLVELGPGKGTLLKNALRAAGQVPGFCGAADVVLVESSARLVDEQKEALTDLKFGLRSVSWTSDITGISEQPTLFIGNEFLDAIPFRQYVKSAEKWQEVGVSLDENRQLQLGILAGELDADMLPAGADKKSDGAVFEIAPAREALVEILAHHIARFGGAALLIDYGHLKSGFGDTFQAVANHEYVDPLATPGLSDLTSHVDFERLGRTARSVRGIDVSFTSQGELLLQLGLLQRAGALGTGKDNDTQDDIRNQVERLASPSQMGELFKAMAIMPAGIRLPGFGSAT